jgi:multisubunit Na+/H+ antiporter MnhC subunit
VVVKKHGEVMLDYVIGEAVQIGHGMRVQTDFLKKVLHLPVCGNGVNLKIQDVPIYRAVYRLE